MKHQGLQEFLQPPAPPRGAADSHQAATGFRKKNFCRSQMRASSSRPAIRSSSWRQEADKLGCTRVLSTRL